MRSKLDYGAIAYSSATRKLLQSIDTIHNKAIRPALGAYHTSPVASILCEAGEPPLAFRRQYLSLSYASKISTNQENPTHANTFSNRLSAMYMNRPRVVPPFYERINKHISDLSITFPKHSAYTQTPAYWTINLSICNTVLTYFNKFNINHDIIIQKFHEIHNNYSEYTTIYTDASKSEEGVGSAIVTPNVTLKFRLPIESSTLTAEIHAILQALIHTKKS
ncbi:hypothetical protein NQ314_018531 [Rhamnusium bicolor]|uniref:Uncharacterized protein n=1 Tax=Rhamnusium bicolor TaxID=1586634 RepID=A0AAV8WQV6_9CUCU|nr:hypothetical protein NQ314_018531 [Rhamnusium bicolor]